MWERMFEGFLGTEKLMGCRERDSAGGRWRMAGTKASGGRGVTGVSHGGKPVMGTRGRREGSVGKGELREGSQVEEKLLRGSETKCKRTGSLGCRAL